MSCSSQHRGSLQDVWLHAVGSIVCQRSDVLDHKVFGVVVVVAVVGGGDVVIIDDFIYIVVINIVYY